METGPAAVMYTPRRDVPRLALVSLVHLDVMNKPDSYLDYVNNNPSGFVNAYFDFASIRIYS